MNFSRILNLFIFPIHQLLLHTYKSCKFWQYLMTDWLLNNLSLFIDLLHVEHHVLNIRIVSKTILQQSDSFEVTHAINERFISWLRINFYLGFVWEFVLRVFIGESEICLFVQLSFECNVEIDNLSLQNIGQRLRVRNYTLYQIGIKG